MDFNIIRSSRRTTLQVRVGIKGVQVNAPAGMPDSDIQDFLWRKEAWIRRALAESGADAGAGSNIFLTGGQLYFQGEACHLECVADDTGVPRLEDFPDGWSVQGGEADRRRLVIKWYRLAATKVFPKLVQAWAVRMALPLPRVVIKDQQRLWGSYSAGSRSVQLNWRMIAFPATILEYIVIHELAHARHLDHSRAFWAEVARFCPDWRARRLWLRTDARKYLF